MVNLVVTRTSYVNNQAFHHFYFLFSFTTNLPLFRYLIWRFHVESLRLLRFCNPHSQQILLGFDHTTSLIFLDYKFPQSSLCISLSTLSHRLLFSRCANVGHSLTICITVSLLAWHICICGSQLVFIINPARHIICPRSSFLCRPCIYFYFSFQVTVLHP